MMNSLRGALTRRHRRARAQEYALAMAQLRCSCSASIIDALRRAARASDKHAKGHGDHVSAAWSKGRAAGLRSAANIIASVGNSAKSDDVRKVGYGR